MPQYRMTVEAVQVGKNGVVVHEPEWVSEVSLPLASGYWVDGCRKRANKGDWIVRCPGGEVLVCAAEEFAKDYTLVEELDPS